MPNTIYHKHHIIPRHAGGSDDQSNLIKLTVEQHALAHLALYEKHNRLQDLIAYKALSGQISGEEARRLAVSAALTGKKQTKEHVKKRVAARMKTNPTPTKGMTLPKWTDERSNKFKKSMKELYANKDGSRLGAITTDETKKLQSQAALNRPRINCEHCGESVQLATYARYHGAKCKHR